MARERIKGALDGERERRKGALDGEREGKGGFRWRESEKKGLLMYLADVADEEVGIAREHRLRVAPNLPGRIKGLSQAFSVAGLNSAGYES